MPPVVGLTKGVLIGRLLLFVCLIISTATLPADSNNRHTVKHVIDGDTLVLENNKHVRLIGINTPELGKHGRAQQPLAMQAKTKLEQLVTGQQIKLVVGREKSDHYGRLLAYVILSDGRDVQEILLRQGLAFMVVISPNDSHSKRYAEIEKLARRQKLGVWADPFYQTKPAAKLTNRDAGFARIRGQISVLRQTKNTYKFELTSKLNLYIPRQYWPLFSGSASSLINKTVVVRGWLRTGREPYTITVNHPTMLQIIN